MRKQSTTYTPRNASLARLCALYAAMGGVSLGCMLGCAGADFEGDESWEEADYGQSEQALRRLTDVGGVSGIAVGELDPGNPDPPPPLPEPTGCQVDVTSDLIAALGYRVLRLFGRVDPGAWECVPGAPLCNAVRLSAALRNADSSPAYLAKLAEVDEFTRYITQAGAMGTFAKDYQNSRDYCAATACKAVPLALDFEPGTPDECGDVSIKVSHRRSTVGDLGGGVLAQANVFTTARDRSPVPLAKGSTATELRLGGQRATSSGSADAAERTAPSTAAFTASASDVLFTYYGLYGHKGPCPPGSSCNANGTNTVIKTYLDHTCEGNSGPDSCYNTQFDSMDPQFYHYMIGTALAASQRGGERCRSWATAARQAAGEPGAFGVIQKTGIMYSCR